MLRDIPAPGLSPLGPGSPGVPGPWDWNTPCYLLIQNGQGAFEPGICDSFPAVGRWHQLFLVFAAALGLAGCLLFSDPVNRAPTVTVSAPDLPVYRKKDVKFTAAVKDDRDNPSSLELRWDVLDPKWDELDPKVASCPSLGPADWRKGLPTTPPDRPFVYAFDTLETKCVCAEVTDGKGAKGYGCSQPIKPSNPPPVAVITDGSGLLSGEPRRLCAQIKLSAEKSDFPVGDPVLYKWGVQYTGSYPAGRSVQLGPCSDDKTGVLQCFYAATAGTYTVSLTIDDVLDKTQTTSGTSPDFVIPVGEDSPPCIRRTDPDVHAQRIMLSRGSDLVGSDQSRTFKAMSVDDDCEPFPTVSGSIAPAQFVWSVLDDTGSGAGNWVRQTDSSESFTVSQAKFPNARPGDTVKIRLEVRDTPVQQTYQSGGVVCADTTDLCCGPKGCSGTANDCVRWTTWTVQFQP